MVADDGVWRIEWIFKFLKIVTAPGLGDRLIGEEETLLLMGTGGLEPMVALALFSLSCVVVRLFSLLLFSFLLCWLYWAMNICNLVRF